jgi:hypothetical protein
LLRIEQGFIVDGGRKLSRAEHHHRLDASFDHRLDASIQRCVINRKLGLGHRVSASIQVAAAEPPC